MTPAGNIAISKPPMIAKSPAPFTSKGGATEESKIVEVTTSGHVVKVEDDRRWAAAFGRYFGHVTPWLGAILAGDREAYTYLPESVEGFLEAGQIAEMMRQAGLHNVLYRTLAMGTVAIHVGEKV